MIPVIFALLLLVASGSIFFIGPASNQDIFVTIDVHPESSSQELQAIIDILLRHNVSATFFITSNWALNNTNITADIVQNFEIACLGVNGSRLALLQEDALQEEVLGCVRYFEEQEIVVQGFRALNRDINKQVQELLLENNLYDSSTYQRYTWFWEKTHLLQTHPISATGLIPLDDRIFSVFRHNSPFYFLARQSRQDDLLIAMNTNTIAPFELDYLLAYYNYHEASFYELREKTWS